MKINFLAIMKKKKSLNLNSKLRLSKKTISSLDNLDSSAAGKVLGGTDDTTAYTCGGYTTMYISHCTCHTGNTNTMCFTHCASC